MGHWERQGTCNRCGDCCLGDPWDGAKGTPVVEGYCPFFRWVDGTATCNDRTETNPYYSGSCSVWPNDPSQIESYSRCSFTFVWVE